MAKESSRTDAVEILRRRVVDGDAGRAAEVERERTNAEVAQLIYDRRVAAGLTQKQLAKLVGTTQSVISRLEDADYEGHSLTMLQRIAGALGQRITIAMAPEERRSA
jgi:ribosome-binding protein aMBF1 (putative translation factor)